MEQKIKEAIEEYQCSGCVAGSDITCYNKGHWGSGCSSHVAGTSVSNIGKIFLGMPIGFNRLGPDNDLTIQIYNDFEEQDENWGYDKFNVPVWKFKDDLGNTLIRGLSPRRNQAFIHIILEDCIDNIRCVEITKEDVKEMD